LLSEQADPASGPVAFTLTPHDLDRRPPDLVFKGRVLNDQGMSIPQATVEPFGFSKGIRAQYGGLKGFDELALTNQNGEFRLGVPEPGIAVYVQVAAPFRAPRKFEKLTSGSRLHELTLSEGVTITGRLVKGGKPLSVVAVGAAQKERDVRTFVGDFQAATDAQGVFHIRNVPSDDTFALYGLMSSLREYGAVGVREVRTGKNGSVSDVGELELRPGHKLSGRVVLADGKPVPAGTRVLLAREEAWDTQQAVVDEEGRFTLTGLPAERYTLSVNVPGYHLSAQNASLDLLNGFRLVGTVREDIEGMNLLLEPGLESDRQPNFDEESVEENRRRCEAPLRGAPVQKPQR
jgi:hypothetical protein